MLQALLESIKKSQSHTPLLIRRVAGALRNLLLPYIAYHVKLFNTLDSIYIYEVHSNRISIIHLLSIKTDSSSQINMPLKAQV